MLSEKGEISMNKEDIKNLHYNNVNEIQYEYGGQIYHCSMEHLKEILVTCWNLQQENKKYKEVIDKMNKLLQQEQDAMTTKFHYDIVGLINALLDILKEVE